MASIASARRIRHLPASIALALALTACGSDDGGQPTPNPSATPSPSPTPSATGAALIPASGDRVAYVDTRLAIDFDAPPVIGSSGQVRVYREDGSLVDMIDLGSSVVDAGGETQTTFARSNTAIDKLGNGVPGATRYRYVYYRPLTVTGNRATIRLHDNVLAPDTDYYVQVDASVLSGVRSGTPFAGIADTTTWRFHTRALPTADAVVVDDDGAADFRTLQGAFDYMMTIGCSGCARASVAKRITIRSGNYDGTLFLRDVNKLTIAGENRAATVVSADNYESFNSGTGGSRDLPNTTLSSIGSASLGTRRVLGGGRSLLLVEGGDELRLTNFTLRNTHVKASNINNQAETIYFNSANLNGSRLIATSMSFLSTQDTVQFKGWVWLYDTLVAGDVDFVWGAPFAVLIENSELRTVVDPTNSTSGGYVFQARAAKGYPGFVVLNSAFTAESGVTNGSAWFARSSGVRQADGYCTTAAVPGGPVSNAQLYCDNIALINNGVGSHIASRGWYSSPSPNLAPWQIEGWRENGSRDLRGQSLDVSGRDTAIASTTVDLSSLSSRKRVFAGWNAGAGWEPME